MLFDPIVLDDLAAALGDAARDMLVAAFRADLDRRPAAIVAQLAAGDVAAARADAHALKGAALVVGAHAVVTVAERIEFGAPEELAALAKELAAVSVALAQDHFTPD